MLLLTKKRVNLLIIVVMFFTIFLSLGNVFFVSPPVGATPQTPQSAKSATSINSEEDTIDSFNVNPKSGRWNVTETGATDDQIIDGNLRLITTENQSSSQSSYLMQRGLSKSNSKVEYRYKATTDNNSQVEYFRDVLGDSADFEEGDTEGLTSESYTVENGIISAIGTSYIDFSPIGENIEYPVYSQITIEMKATENLGLSWSFRIQKQNFLCKNTATGYTITTEWQTITLQFPSSCNGYTNYIIQSINLFTGPHASNPTVYVKDIKITGDRDYATHVEGEVEDTWDWEDSKEYFYDDYGNVSDFNDGSEEVWVNAVGDPTQTQNNAGNEYLQLYDSDSVISIQSNVSLSIDTATYRYLTIEFNNSGNVNIIEIRETDYFGQIVCSDGTGWTANSWHLFTCDLGLDADWTGTKTGFYIKFNTVPGNTIFLNMIYLYDMDLGDLEGASGSDDYQYVSPEGYFKFKSTGIDDFMWIDGLSINPSEWTNYIFRAKSTTNNVITLIPRGRDNENYGAGLTLSTSWQILNYYLPADPDWDDGDTLTGIGFFVDVIGTIANLEHVYIDYLFLETNKTEEQEFTVGFFDSATSTPLVNITHHFYNSTTFRWETELFDANNEVVSYYYSNNYTVTDEYYYVKISYDTLGTAFSITINADNQSRIFKADYGDEFSSSNVRPLFFTVYHLDFFVDSRVKSYGSTEIWLDYINAPYNEQSWRHIVVPTDTDWLADNWDSVRTQATLSGQNSTWELNIPRLDAVSGKLQMNTTNNYNFALDDNYYAEFGLFGVDKSSGDMFELIRIRMQYHYWKPLTTAELDLGLYIYVGGSLFYQVYGTFGLAKEDQAPVIEFSIASREQRSILALNARVYNSTTTTKAVYDDIQANVSIANINPNYANEYVLSTQFYVYDQAGSNVWYAKLVDFDFKARDIFQDLANIIVDPFGGDNNPLVGAFRWLSDIITRLFRFLVNALITFLLPALAVIDYTLKTIIQPILNTINNSIQTAITWLNTISTTLTNIYNYLSTSIYGAIDGIEALLTQISGFVDGLESLLTDISNTLTGMANDISSIWGVITSIVTDMVNEFVNSVADILTEIGNNISILWNDIVKPIIDNILNYLSTIITDILHAIADGAASLWDYFWTTVMGVIDPSGDLTTIVTDTFQFFDDMITGFFNVINFLGVLLPWVVILVVFFIFTFPYIQNTDQHGRVNIGGGTSGMLNNAFRGLKTPHITVLGFGGSIVIPLILLLYVALKLLIASGVFPDIFAGLPI